MKSVQAEILATGEELRTGALIDSNSAHIAQALQETGVQVTRHTCVGDDLSALVAVFGEIGQRADLAVVTGGLGPTVDDLTAEAAARAMGCELVLDGVALSHIEGFFRQRGRTLSPSNRKQAFFPKGSDRLDNPIGTAPGFSVVIGRCRFFFVPGVPAEMRKMLSEQVLPRVQGLFADALTALGTRTICTFGGTESGVGEMLAGLAEALPGVQLGLRAKFPEIQVKLYARGTDKEAVESLLNQGTEKTAQILGKWVFSTEGKPMEAVVGELLCARSQSLAVAESCTGGLIAHWLTQVPGSSHYFRFSGVTYSNATKASVLGVSPETLNRHGAVHEEVARQMAEGTRRVAGATYGIATSGIAGPEGGTAEKPVGTVCVGLATPKEAFGYRFYFPFPQRERNKSVFAMTALEVLRRHLLDLPPPQLGSKTR